MVFSMGEMFVPQTTPAVRIFEHGDENVLRYGEYPLEPPGPEDVVVQVQAASVSRWDIKYRVGLPVGYRLPGQAAFPLPQQLGREAAGRVIAVGDAVDQFNVGDHVVAVVHPEDPTSLEAARGLGNLSPNVAIPGHQSLGAYAKYLVRHQTMWLPLDSAIDLEQAAVKPKRRAYANWVRMKCSSSMTSMWLVSTWKRLPVVEEWTTSPTMSATMP